jgi:hypothetical protein
LLAQADHQFVTSGRVGRTPLSAAFEFDFELKTLQLSDDAASNLPTGHERSTAAGNACPERSRRECPPHTSVT